MDVGLGDDEQDVLALLHRHAHDRRDRLHAELLHGLSRLLLVAVLLTPLRLLCDMSGPPLCAGRFVDFVWFARCGFGGRLERDDGQEGNVGRGTGRGDERGLRNAVEAGGTSFSGEAR